MSGKSRLQRFARGSWKTTILGAGMILYALGAVTIFLLAGNVDGLRAGDIATIVLCLLAGIGFILARDDDVTSENAGATRRHYPQAPLILIGLLLLGGCADTRMPNAIENAQFTHIVEAVEEQARERPPVTPREAKRLTFMRNVATQGVQLTEVELKHKGPPDKAVPSATDFAAVHHATKVFEEEVEAELAIRGLIEPFIPKGLMSLPNAMGTGGVGVVVTALMGLWRSRGKLAKKASRQKLALGQMFALAAENVEKDKLSKALDGTEAQAEFRTQREEKRNGHTGKVG